jgi:hypothetical protein
MHGLAQRRVERIEVDRRLIGELRSGLVKIIHLIISVQSSSTSPRSARVIAV